MTTVIEDGGRTNIYAKEPPMEIMDVTETHNEKAEKLNGRLAMLGVMAALVLTQSLVKLFPESGNANGQRKKYPYTKAGMKAAATAKKKKTTKKPAGKKY